MLSATSNLVQDLLGNVFVAWLSCEPVLYLLGLIIVATIITILFNILKP